MGDPAGNVLPDAADEVNACAFVFLRIWRIEMRGTAAAGVRGFSTIVLSASSSEILVDDNIMKISEGLISPGIALVDGMATAGRFGGISLSSLAADENIEYNSEEIIAPGILLVDGTLTGRLGGMSLPLSSLLIFTTASVATSLSLWDDASVSASE